MRINTTAEVTLGVFCKSKVKFTLVNTNEVTDLT